MPKRKLGIGRVIAFFVLIILLIGLIAASALTIWYKSSLSAVSAEQCTGDKCTYESFHVAEGSSVQSVAESLESKKLIKSALIYRLYMATEGKGMLIKAGDYSVNNHMSVQDFAKMFDTGAQSPTFRITFLPGGTIMDAKKRLKAQGYKDDEIEAAFAKNYDHPALKGKPENASLEGYIYGETYEFYTSASVEDILTRTFDELQKLIAQENLEQRFAALGLSLYEGINLASVVQRESGTIPGDMSHVAQVFLTRLNRKIPLGSDAVIGYAADLTTENRDKTDMSYLNTIGCPWNSRKCSGLPPSPISSPGKGALLATAEPTDTDDLYFLTGDDQKMYYAKTESEHNENIKKYCKVMCGYL